MKQDPDLTQNISNKVVNILTPTIKKYSSVLNASFEVRLQYAFLFSWSNVSYSNYIDTQSVWRALLMNGSSLDYLCGIAQVFEEVIAQSKRQATLAEVETVRTSTLAALGIRFNAYPVSLKKRKSLTKTDFHFAELVATNKLRLFSSWKNEIEFNEGLMKALDHQNSGI
jgi:hypothetical protein